MPVLTPDLLNKPADPALVRPLLDLTAELAVFDTDAAIHLGTAANAFLRSRATIAVGGYFKSGKSSLLNAVIGRHVLPTNELPETGVACRIIPVGADESDAAFVHFTGDNRKPEQIELSPEAISSRGGRLTRAGETRASVTSEVERIELRLRATSIPVGCHWLDTPGIGEDALMDELAMRYALGADRLLWVLSSRSLISTTESQFLQRYVERRGPRCLSFVINAFISVEEPATVSSAWNTFTAEKLKDHMRRLQEHCAAYQLGEHIDVPVVSARHLVSHAIENYGGRELSTLVQNRFHPQGPLVRQARLSAVLCGARDAAQSIDRAIERCSHEIAGEKLRLDHQRDERARLVDIVVGLCQDIIRHIEKNHVPGVLRHAQRLAAQVSDTSVLRDGTYQKDMNDYVRESNAEALSDLKEHLPGAAAESLGCRLNLAALEARITRLLPAPDLSISISSSNDSAMGKGAAGGAVAGAIIGSVVPVFGTALGAGIGALAGLFGGAGVAVDSDKQTASSIRSQIRSQMSVLAEHYTTFYAALQDEIGGFLIDGNQIPACDPAKLLALQQAERLRDRMSSTLREARLLLGEHGAFQGFGLAGDNP